MKRMRFMAIVLLIISLVLVIVPTASAKSSQNPGVLPPNTPVNGFTYGEWMARWWHFVITLPAPENPLTGMGPLCSAHQVGNVALVVVNSTAGVTIQCQAQAGSMLFFEILGSECSTLEPPPFYGGNPEELRACAHTFVPNNLQVSVDGGALHDLDQYIVTSPVYHFTLPEDNVLGVPAGSTGLSVGYGAYVMFAPFSPGKHTLHFHGEYPDFGFVADRTIEVTVKR